MSKITTHFRLVSVCFVIHGVNAGMMLYYILKKFKPRQGTNKEIGIDVDDKSRGTAMIF